VDQCLHFGCLRNLVVHIFDSKSKYGFRVDTSDLWRIRKLPPGVADGPKIISPVAAAIETKQSENECFVPGLGKML